MKRPNVNTPSRHVIEQCTPHRLAGWSTAPHLQIAINDRRVGVAVPSIQRNDLLEAGFPSGRGFGFAFDQSLWPDDEVSLHAAGAADLRFRMDGSFAERIRELTRYLHPERQVGLEIGPLDRPLMPRSRFRVFTLDQASHTDLLARFVGQGVNLSTLVAPDFVSGGSTIAAAVGDLRFDYCLASHVIEHVPDMIGWLWEIWDVLKDGGVLSLAVPHGEKTFDARRRLSSLAELADAYFGRFTQPSTRQIIDAQIGAALYHGSADPVGAAFTAFHQANHARKARHYVDLHCNVFTPESFVHNLQCLDRCKLLGFDLLSTGYRGDDEFTAHLRKRSDKMLPDHLRP